MDGLSQIADTKDVPSIPSELYRLKVDELKQVCRGAGLPCSGKKADLQGRIRRALENGNKKAHEALHPYTTVSGKVHWQRPTIPCGSCSYSEPSNSSQTGSTQLNNQCICKKPVLSGFSRRCDECSRWQHCACVGILNAMPDEYICVRCRAERLDPFWPPSTMIMDPHIDSWLIPANQLHSSHHQCVMRFFLSYMTLQMVGLSSGKQQFVLRCFLADAGRKRNHRWPLRSDIHLNGEKVPHVQQPQSWDGVSLKDKNEDLPLYLPYKLLRSGENAITILSSDPVSHICSLLIVEACALADVEKKVLEKGMLPKTEALERVRAVSSTSSDDDGIIMGALSLSLVCPLSHTRVVTPVRSFRCKHLECFDLHSYLALACASKFPKYLCPRCNAPARPHELRVDSWMLDVLATLPNGVTEVEVDADGTHRVVEEKPPVPTRKRKTVETVEIDIGMDEANPICLD